MLPCLGTLLPTEATPKVADLADFLRKEHMRMGIEVLDVVSWFVVLFVFLAFEVFLYLVVIGRI